MKALGYFGLFAWTLASSQAEQFQLQYSPAPAGNPLKGFVPYVHADGKERFPHSMQFCYFALADFMTRPGQMDWTALEDKLKNAQEEGCQLIFRVVTEYPGEGQKVPQWLLDGGVDLITWQGDDDVVHHTPDYEHPLMRQALADFIQRLGNRYDGDPRIGFISAGLLGAWGEWHTYPRDDLWASSETQEVVLRAFAESFSKTPILLRYPKGTADPTHATTVNQGFGYHDDSFNWSTIRTGAAEDEWCFQRLMEIAGESDAWQNAPIGGELRPELWATSFTPQPHPRAQGFDQCVDETHVSWLMDSGLFSERFPLSEERRTAATQAAQRMGYAFFVSHVERTAEQVQITVTNRGVAPLYADWPVELVQDDKVLAQFHVNDLLPGDTRVWNAPVGLKANLHLRVPNPMKGGKALRFANAEQEGAILPLP